MKYKDKTLPPEERAKDLLSRMTLDEKFQQVRFHAKVNDLYKEFCEKGEITARFGTFYLPRTPEVIRELQDYCLNKTRLGIPLLISWEAIRGIINAHDYLADSSDELQFVTYPQCLGIAGTFNREYVYNMAKNIGIEASNYGIRQLYAPNVDIPRDPRWGRMQENYGEDPYLAGEMGVAYIKGLQSEGVAATAKHFIGYGVGEGGINLAPAHVGEREVREVMLEPFKKCIDAGVLSVMPAYNEIDGEPLHASKKYLRDILRDELGFDGVTVSDYAGVSMLNFFQNVAKDLVEAGKMALEAGVDVEAPYVEGYCDELKEEIREGRYTEEYLNEAVLRILTLKFKLGLFENPYPMKDKVIDREKMVELALKMEEDSIVLLENDGILPLDEKKIQKVAVIGNNAVGTFMGDYTTGNRNRVDFLDGIKNRLGEDRVEYAQGCAVIHTTDELISEAVETAKRCDTVFLVLGGAGSMGGGVPGQEKETQAITDGEGYDVHDLNLLPSQRRLFDAITALGKPTVLVFYSGRPYTLMEDVKKVNAFLYDFGGGEQSGNAMANLIFGDKTPSAKLAVSFPQTVGHLPCYYNHKPSSKGFYKKPGSIDNVGRDYVLSSPEPWYPFGYGLSYTKVEYSNLKAEVLNGGVVNVSVDVENKGSYDINESVLVFVRTMYCPVTPFVKKLYGFDKVLLKSGEKKTVNFTLTEEDFTYVDFDMKTAVSHGAQKIMVEDMEVLIEY